MRLSHLSAVAVMIALVGAMFVAMGSASAFDFAECAPHSTAAPATNYLLANDTCNITNGNSDHVEVSDTTIVSVPKPTDGADEGALGAANVDVTAVAPGAATVKVTDAVDDSVTTYRFEVLSAPTISISFDDNDGIVKAGTPVVATITTRGFAANHRVEVSVPSTGLYFTAVDFTDDDEATWSALVAPSQQIVYSAAPGTYSGFSVGQSSLPDGVHAKVTLSTTGAPVGTYAVTASAATAAPGTDGRQAASDSEELQIGDPGSPLASATLSLGKKADGSAETGSVIRNGTINLVVEAFNSLGEKANDPDVEQVIVFASVANVSLNGGMSHAGSQQIVEMPSPPGEEVKQTTNVVVTRSTPGVVSVRATVIGDANDVNTETIELTFTGTPETHETASPGDSLAQTDDVYDGDADPPKEGGLKFEVSGIDSAGNQSALTIAAITARVMDADDKVVTAKFTVTEEIKANSNGIVVVRVGTGSSKLTPGAYTLETKLTGKDTQETAFSVSGPPADVSVETESSTDDIALGSVITVTATVTDKDGVSVVDGSFVDFGTGGALELKPVGKVTNVPTADGVASARFVVSKGLGLAVIVVDASDTATDGDVDASGTASVSTAPEPVDAMPEEEASLGCLSSLSGFSTWTCDVEASASEIFDWISSRGATALHLNSNRMWVRYSVVDGAMVPGSSDFMVTKSDILYISN